MNLPRHIPTEREVLQQIRDAEGDTLVSFYLHPRKFHMFNEMAIKLGYEDWQDYMSHLVDRAILSNQPMALDIVEETERKLQED